MIDEKAASNDQGANPARVRWGLVLTSVLVIIGLIFMIAIGTILVNVEWPTDLGEWLKLLLGGLLILISSIGTTYAVSAVQGIIKDKGGGTDKNRDRYLAIERLSRISFRRVLTSIALAGAVFAGVTLFPQIPVPSPPPVEEGEIRLMIATDESERDARLILIDQWNAAHPENRVVVMPVSQETDDQHEAMVNDARGEREADVYALDIVWMPEFIDRGYIRRIDESRLTEYEGDQFLSNVWDTCLDLKGGRPGRWALPFNSDAGLLYYRPAWGVSAPQGWRDYFGEPAKATLDTVRSTPAARRTAPNLVAATAAQLDQQEVLTIAAFEAMWAADGEVVDQTGEVNLNADRSEVDFDGNALAGLVALAAAAQDPEIVDPRAGDAEESGARATFADGRTLFMRDWPVAHDGLVENDMTGIPFEATSLPHTSVLGGQNLAISSESKRPRAAQELIEFLTSPASQLTLFEVGGFAPTRSSAYTNSRRPYATELRSAVERARPRPVLVHYTEFSEEFRKGIRRALNTRGELEPDFAGKLAEIVKKG